MKPNIPIRRRLIINADDFGLSAGVNRGVIEVFERGVVTSASLMVRHPAAGAAATYAARHPTLSLGLHVDLGEWTYDGGRWSPVYEVVQLADPPSVAAEIVRQLDTFRVLTGSNPTHLDSHQHVHMFEPVLSLAEREAARLGVPLRGRSALVRHSGEFYGQTGTGESLSDGITVDRLREIVAGLPAGMTELSCHPGLDPELESAYRLERIREVETLGDEQWPEVLAGERIELTSFAELAAEGNGSREAAEDIPHLVESL